MVKEQIIKSFVGSRGGGAAHPPYIKVVPLNPKFYKFYPRLYALGSRPLKKNRWPPEAFFQVLQSIVDGG
jgi:hypothetical protein